MPELVTSSFNIGGNYGSMALKFSFKDGSFDEASLTSKITWTIKGYGSGNTTSSIPYVYVKNVSLTLDGSTYTYWTTSKKLHDGDVIATGEKVIKRNADGNKTLSVSLSGLFAGTSTKTGSKTFTLAQITPQTKPPIISGLTATPNNSNTTVDGWGIFLQGYSKANVTAAVTPQNGTIKSVVYTVDEKGTTSLITRSGTVTVKCVATDSYDNESTATTSITVEPYSNPILSEWIAVRCNENGNADTKGSYIKLKCTAGYSSCAGHNSMAINATVTNLTSGTSEEINLESGTESIVGGEYLSTVAYSVKFNATDLLGNTVPAEVKIPVQDVGLNFCRANGKSGAAFFDYANEPGVLKVNGKMKLPAQNGDFAEVGSFITHRGYMPNVGQFRRYDDGLIEIWGYLDIEDTVNIVESSGVYLSQDTYGVNLKSWDETLCPKPVSVCSINGICGRQPSNLGLGYLATVTVASASNTGAYFRVVRPISGDVDGIRIYYKISYWDYEI